MKTEITPTSSGTEASTERRSDPRLKMSLPARVVGDGWTREAETVDLSEGGVLLAGADFPSGTHVRLEIELAEAGRHTLDAEIVRHEEDASGEERLAARFARVATEGGRAGIQAFFEARLGDRRAA